MSTDGDVRWQGPFYIDRGRWWPTRFTLYEGTLYCSVDVGRARLTLSWEVGTAVVRYESGFSTSSWEYVHGPALWEHLLGQVVTRLRSAVRNPAAYNARVARGLPLAYRSGRIARRSTWPTRARPPMSATAIARLEQALTKAGRARAWRAMSVRRFLTAAGIAYDAVFPDMRRLEPLAKYRKRADTRHGGMLDLPSHDAEAFSRWHASRDWLGAHPWEIVFAHPHGIMLTPHQVDHGWRFYLSVDTLGLYVSTARMAIALAEGGVPVELVNSADVLAAIRGDDEVEIGPFAEQLPLEDLAERRPGAAGLVVWDAPPVLTVRSRTASPRGRTRTLV